MRAQAFLQAGRGRFVVVLAMIVMMWSAGCVNAPLYPGIADAFPEADVRFGAGSDSGLDRVFFFEVPNNTSSLRLGVHYRAERGVAIFIEVVPEVIAHDVIGITNVGPWEEEDARWYRNTAPPVGRWTVTVQLDGAGAAYFGVFLGAPDGDGGTAAAGDDDRSGSGDGDDAATGNQTAGNQTSGNQTSGIHTASNQAAGNHAAGGQTTGSWTTGNQAGGNHMAGNQAAGNHMAGNHGAGDQTTGNQAVGNQAAGDQAAGNQAAGNQTAALKATGDENRAPLQGDDSELSPQTLSRNRETLAS